jgi:transcriptional regulator with XRE-family HTH domain
MTPFGAKLRMLRAEINIEQKELAQALGVSPAYLSGLEHGKKGAPPRRLVLRVIEYFNLIWDAAEELENLAKISQPKVIIDTASMHPKATILVNKLGEKLGRMDEAELDLWLNRLD